MASRVDAVASRVQTGVMMKSVRVNYHSGKLLYCNILYNFLQISDEKNICIYKCASEDVNLT